MGAEKKGRLVDRARPPADEIARIAPGQGRGAVEQRGDPQGLETCLQLACKAALGAGYAVTLNQGFEGVR